MSKTTNTIIAYNIGNVLVINLNRSIYFILLKIEKGPLHLSQLIPDYYDT